ncbi:MAG: hypothetical protein ACOCXF_04890 [bacterium]
MSNNSYDFSRFAAEFYPLWEQQFRTGDSAGEYSYAQGGKTSLYGSTDIIFCRAIMDNIELSAEDRDSWAGVINRFQKPDSGWYRKLYTWNHLKQHTSAYAVAALALIGRRPHFELKVIKELLEQPQHWERWIRRVPWSVIWPGSHIVAAIPAVAALLGYPHEKFMHWYFDWLDREADPATGFWCRGLVHKLGLLRRPTKHEMGGAFHMYYVYEYFGRQWRYPVQVINTTLSLQQPNGFWDGEVSYCIDLDGIYNLTRSSKIAGDYRQEDIRRAITRYLESTEALLNDRERFFASYSNSHMLPAVLAAIAEIQKFYPELVHTPKPWRQVIDEVCFI